MTPRREALAQMPPETLVAALEWVRLHGALTEPTLRRAVRDRAILDALARDLVPGRTYRVARKLGLSEATVRKVLGALSSASETRAIRRLVVVSRSSAEQLLEMETDQAAKTRALREAALCTSDEAKEAVLGFFSQLGISLDVSPVSLTGLGSSQEPSQSGETTGGAPSGDS